jgi:hypothetical protein
MGRQVNFYMLPEDLNVFEDNIRSRTPLSFIRGKLERPAIIIEPTLNTTETNNSWLRMYIARNIDLESVVIRSVEKQGYWVVASDQSPVVEIDRCYWKDNILRRGRLYFNLNYLDANNQVVSKSPEFVQWADDLLKWIRRNYERDKNTGFYLSPNAKMWSSNEKNRLV